MSVPAISVIMAVHNGQPYLEDCVASVLSQSVADFEFIVIDDASSDGSTTVLEALAARDNRIKLTRNANNIGLTRSLNVGLEQARGEYIARIDADDLCRPKRLEAQLEAMLSDPDLIILGSGYGIIDEHGAPQGEVSVALSDARIRWLLGFSPPSFHPTYFFRRLAPDGTLVRYDEAFRTAQDFDLWSRLSKQGPGRVLADVLIDYRRHASGISVTQRLRQAEDGRKVSQRNLIARLPEALVAELEPLSTLLNGGQEARGPAVKAAVVAMRKLLSHDKEFFTDPADRKWMRRTAAGLLADAVLSRGKAIKRPMDTLRFVFHAADFLPALAKAIAERPATARKALARLTRK
ncbi:MAG: glycosyltransferase [Silicimonas sp.]|nr:glycosyltransferase [Silicimonas sp.]